jgi:hypothetical protein
MKFKSVATVSALLTFINGSFFLVAPVWSLSVLGRSTNAIGVMNTRISGACAIGLSVITWLAKESRYRDFHPVVAWGNLTMFGLLVFVDLHGIITGSINELGWLILFADLILFLCFIIYLSHNYGMIR